MSLENQKQRIINRKAFNKDNHAGGMWKVAYADFVTAMMTFFMLMWILNSSTKERLEGIAKFFTPEAKSKTQEEVKKLNQDDYLYTPSFEQGISQQEKDFFAKIMISIKNNEKINNLDNVMLDITNEGLRIQIIDSDKRPMFKPGTDNLQPYIESLLVSIAEIIKPIQNYISVVGNTASIRNSNSIDLWGLSINRANKIRIFLSQYLGNDRIVKISGQADKNLFDDKSPYGNQNIRIEIILLSKDLVNKNKSPIPKGSLFNR